MADSSSRAADVLIIGGGIIGCSIAWRLAQAGMKVTVLDRASPGAEASSAAAGMLAPVSEALESQTFSDFCVASRNLYREFAAEVEEASGQSTGYRSEGCLLVATNDRTEKELAAIHRQQAARGYTLHELSATELQDRGAGLSPQVRRGLFIPDDHCVDNERLMRALLIACERAGVRIEAGTAAHHFHRKNDGIEGVVAGNDSRFTADTYVLAAGSWSGEVAKGMGLHLSVTPCRGQMMEFECPQELPFVVRSGIHYMLSRSDRRLVVGTTSEFAGFEKAVTAGGLLSILQGVAGLAPRVGEFRFLRAWAGLRPDTTDHLPILGYGEVRNVLLATGHFRNGILLAPMTAEIAADLIGKGSTSRPIEAYNPKRFQAARAIP